VFRRTILSLVQRRPLLTAAALTQVGHTIIMVKD
jgi:hypothetical protein